MSKVFETLDRMSQTSGGGKLPEWLATHPSPGNRIEHIQKMLDTLKVDPSKGKINREEYLQHVQGMTYGDDPQQGYFEGSHFYHPQMHFQLTFPERWQTQNTAQAVVALSPNQDAIVQLGLAGDASPRQAAQQFLSQQGVQAGQGSTASINGFPAATSYFEAQTQQGNIQGLVSFISYGGTTFGIMGYTAAGKLGSYDNLFSRTISSFSELKDQSKLNVQPAKVELVRLNRSMTLEQFNSQYPSSIPIEQVAIINEVEGPSTMLAAGRTMKRVVGGRSPQAS